MQPTTSPPAPGIAAEPDAPQADARQPLERIARRQRVALGAAAVGVVIIAACSVIIARPLPTPASPPADIAPLLIGSDPPAPGGQSSAAGAPAPIGGVAYLAFLKQIDQQRGTMVTLYNSSLATAAISTAAQNAASTTSLVQSAQSLQSAFQAQPAPAVCSPLAAAYAKLLQDQAI